MNPVLATLLATLLGYLVGAIPNGVLAARLFGFPDPRLHDTGHTGGLNSLRGGGPLVGVAVGLLDFGKGMLAVWLAARLAPDARLVAVPLAGAAAVVGHCWSVYIGFKGGMGLATGAGAGAAHVPLIPVVAAAAWGLLYLAIRQRSRAVIPAALLVPPAMWLLRRDAETLWLGLAITLVILVRHLPALRRARS